MKWLCKIFGHKYTEYRDTTIIQKNELWVIRTCKRCGKYDGKWLPL